MPDVIHSRLLNGALYKYNHPDKFNRTKVIRDLSHKIDEVGTLVLV